MRAICHTLTRKCASIKVPIVDIQSFLTSADSAKSDCKTVAEALHKFGCLVIKDLRVEQTQNDRFLNMMERFFDSRSKDYYEGRPVRNVYPEYDFQVGATPQFTEKAKDHGTTLSSFSPENKPMTPMPPPFDAKWRYFWDVSTDDSVPKRYPNQAPEDFPEFREVMDNWGRHMINGCYTVAEMAAVGLGLQRSIFTKALNGGEHKLAPTGSDLQKYDVGTIFAGYHYDFNFLTIHGKSRYPGLFAWLRTGEKFPVAVPQGHLLLQAGKQFEWLTGGYINCGFHEVVYHERVKQLKEQAIRESRIPWRVSSTLFSHLRQNVTMEPFGRFATAESKQKYPPISVRDHTVQQLSDISLKRSDQ